MAAATTLELQQTDALTVVCPTTPKKYCCPKIVTSAYMHRQAALGGAAGLQNYIISMNVLEYVSKIFWLCHIPDEYLWEGGSWEIPLYVSRGDATGNVKWEDTYVCKVDTNGVCSNVSALGSVTGQATALSAGGTYKHFVTVSADGGSDGGRYVVYIVGTLKNYDNAGAHTVRLRSNQPIITSYIKRYDIQQPTMVREEYKEEIIVV